MSNNMMWMRYYLKNYLARYFSYRKQQIIEKYGIRLDSHLEMDLRRCRRVAGKKLLSIYQTNELIKEVITSSKRFWVGRYGGMEMGMIASVLEERHFKKSSEKQNCFEGLCTNAGFFPCKIELADKFVDLMLNCCNQVDLLGTWDRLYMEDYIIKRYMGDCDLTRLAFLEPWYTYLVGKDLYPWTKSLKGKRVLVVHPFAETIQQQYESNRKKIFGNIYREEDILPEFTLITLKAIQTQANTRDNRFENWFQALEWMTSAVAGIKFDVAILGCGAYGFPLAAEIKKMGKIAIHLGGATQLMFGIRGKRWDNSKRMQPIYNEYWVRPSAKEKIRNAEQIEDACYW